LTSSILNHTYENGRRYHAFHQGEYPLPNDDKEQDRLDLLHHIWKLLLGGGLYVAPIPPNPQRVLDFGTGTGIWAIDFADEFPSAKVIGTDLSPMQPWWVPPNCTFYVDDSDNEWTFQPDEAFDYIHGRAMGGSIKDWDVLYREIYKHLKPGGYVEIQEYETWIQQNDETKETPQYLMKWQAGVNEAASKFGKPMFVARDHKKNMIAAGFVDVEDIAHKVISAMT
jgi:SAM-dependent methyltransferase